MVALLNASVRRTANSDTAQQGRTSSFASLDIYSLTHDDKEYKTEAIPKDARKKRITAGGVNSKGKKA
jgi:hypothetical protein